jgi:hypothetical protein
MNAIQKQARGSRSTPLTPEELEKLARFEPTLTQEQRAIKLGLKSRHLLRVVLSKGTASGRTVDIIRKKLKTFS